MQTSSSIFREEVAVARSERLFGDIAVVVPVSWQAVGFLLFFAVLTGIGFLSMASYSRVETVAGTVVPAAGVAPVLPTRTGVLVRIPMVEGQTVQAGQAVAFVRVEEEGTDGGSAGERIEQAIARQGLNITAQLKATQASASSLREQLIAQRIGLRAEIEQLKSQVEAQHSLISTAQRAYDGAKEVATRGFVSQRDLDVRVDNLVGRQQVLAQLNQALAVKQSQLAEAEKNADQSQAQSRAQVAAIETSRAQIEEQAAAARGNRSYAIRAPVAGRIAALTARVGQPATPQVPLMTIVPQWSPLRAELAVPSPAIGFVKPRQEVRLAIDAFPYQRFGTVRGRILTVANSPVAQVNPNGISVSVYPVVVELNETSIQAYGHGERLVPGMTLYARIVTERQTLVQWLFDPLFAVSQR